MAWSLRCFLLINMGVLCQTVSVGIREETGRPNSAHSTDFIIGDMGASPKVRVRRSHTVVASCRNEARQHCPYAMDMHSNGPVSHCRWMPARPPTTRAPRLSNTFTMATPSSESTMYGHEEWPSWRWKPDTQLDGHHRRSISQQQQRGACGQGGCTLEAL